MPLMELGHPSTDVGQRVIAADRQVLDELESLLQGLKAAPDDLLVARIRQLRILDERISASDAQDVAMIEVLAPASEVPAPARILQLRRNAVARHALVEEFGLYSSAELAELRAAATENPSSEPARWLREGRIFAVPGSGDRRFPAFEFDESGRPLAAVRPVLGVLAPVLRGWELALWFTGANVALRGRRPVDLLGSNADAVLEAARYEAATGSW